MAPTYKLTYFDVKALAEPIRILFHYKGVEFEDVRVKFEEWPTLKSEMPWNVLPVLEEDGNKLCQSLAILRYLGRKFKLAGESEWETAKCDEFVDAMSDIRIEASKTSPFSKEEPAKKAEIKKNLQEVILPTKYAKFNEQIKANGNGLLVGKSVTYADIYVAYMGEWLGQFVEFDKMGDYPEMVAHQKKILGLPGIKEWIANRPPTQF